MSRFLILCLKIGVTASLLLVLLGVVGMQYSTTPRFCTTCHYMQPFYDSWQLSSHKNVRCVDCHYPPGLQHEFQKKFEALVQVTKYVTRQYGTRAVTQVEDASCLRSGCHQVRLLRGKVLFKGVEFDHLPHLTKHRRVTRLRCTSCHSQMVQGQHMAVTESSCFLCHFKNDVKGKKTELSSCTRCHKFPLPAKKFNHAFVQEREIKCQECHANVTHGNGDVPKTRCVMCHSEKSRLERYTDVAFMHENHVTERKIECQQCHDTIQHNLDNVTRNASGHVQSGDCRKCHESEHNMVAQLYSGRGGAGITGTPDPMFTAGVSCEACHRSYQSAGGTSFSKAGAAGCMMCHGEKYGAKLTQWHGEFDGAVRETYTAIAKAKTLLAADALRGDATNSAAFTSIENAETNITLLLKANSIHNPRYARQLIRKAVEQANQALLTNGNTFRVPMPALREQTTTTACATCHTKTPSGSLPIFGAQFNHTRHVNERKLDCETCHRQGAPEKPSHGQLKIDAAGCRACHTRQRANSPHPATWASMHGTQAKHDSKECMVCHTKDTCTSCHGVTMPHAQGWLTKHGPASRTDGAVCRKCHQQTDCNTCHQNKRPHPSPWIPQHGKQAMASPAKCNACHQQTDCAVCHKSLKPAFHDQTWPTAHPQSGTKQGNLCKLCHATGKKGDFCTTCHGLKMPHAENFATEHKGVASFADKAVCFKCHSRKEFCVTCHGDDAQ